VTMTLTTKQLLTLAGVAACASTLACAQFRPLSEDENPIRVRNKILHFDTEGKQSFWKKDNDTRVWRLKKNKHGTTVFEVLAFGADSGCLDAMKGTSVAIVFELRGGVRKNFVFTIEDKGEGNEPAVDPGDVTMREDNSSYTKKLGIDGNPEGAIKEVTVTYQSTTKTCTFPDDRRVLVELCRNQCS
jgi:hypothetical protein